MLVQCVQNKPWSIISTVFREELVVSERQVHSRGKMRTYKVNRTSQTKCSKQEATEGNEEGSLFFFRWRDKVRQKEREGKREKGGNCIYW